MTPAEPTPAQLRWDPLPLLGRVAVVTGVSRRAGIGYAIARRRFPQQRWGVPDDPARLIAWLVTDEAAWITGQVINTEGGFRRWDRSGPPHPDFTPGPHACRAMWRRGGALPPEGVQPAARSSWRTAHARDIPDSPCPTWAAAR